MKKLHFFLLIIFIFISLPSLAIGQENLIYIKENGTVEGTDKIQQYEDVYFFVGNITADRIIVERDNMVLNGNGYTIQGNKTNGGLLLKKTTNVTIQNIRVKNCCNGISLSSSHNITVIECIITANSRNGISLMQSSNNSILGNTIATNGYHGIALWACPNNSISGNNITANNLNGIDLFQSPYSSVNGNSITENNDDGIRLWTSSKSNIQENSIAENNGDGIRIWTSSKSNITKNTISKNNWIGIRLSESYNNSIYHNNFIDNYNHVQDLAWAKTRIFFSVNFWNDTFEGNYWSGYNGTDSNNDGIGDIPYVIDENNQDNYPLMEQLEIETISEFPSWTILPLLVVGALVGVIVRNKT